MGEKQRGVRGACILFMVEEEAVRRIHLLVSYTMIFLGEKTNITFSSSKNNGIPADVEINPNISSRVMSTTIYKYEYNFALK